MSTTQHYQTKESQEKRMTKICLLFAEIIINVLKILLLSATISTADDYALVPQRDYAINIMLVPVILDSSGYTKGYGFVRFGNEEEQRNALYAMNGYTGLGSKPLKICTAVPKPKGATTQNPTTPPANNTNYSSGTEYNQYYDPSAYWQNYSAWSGYYGQGEQSAAGPATPVADTAQPPPAKAPADDLALVEHKKVIDVDQLNQEFMDPELSLWDSLESSQWFPHEVVEAH